MQKRLGIQPEACTFRESSARYTPRMLQTRLNRLLSAAAEIALETLWPTRCAVCDTPGEDVLCKTCAKSLLVVDANMACPICGAPYGRVQCSECNEIVMNTLGLSALPIDGMAHALVLDEAARKIVRTYKDCDERRLCGVIAEYMARNISPDARREGYVLGYIPDTKAALRRRGFDHSEEIACAVAGITELPLERFFERPSSTDQRKLGRKERIENMRDCMRIRNEANIPQRVLLLDDVCTTGATILSAASALKRAGAQEVRAVTFARVLD